MSGEQTVPLEWMLAKRERILASLESQIRGLWEELKEVQREIAVQTALAEVERLKQEKEALERELEKERQDHKDDVAYLESEARRTY